MHKGWMVVVQSIDVKVSFNFEKWSWYTFHAHMPNGMRTMV